MITIISGTGRPNSNTKKVANNYQAFLQELNIEANVLDLGINLVYQFENNHDRFIDANNGWKITLGRGLDIFEKTEGRFNVADMDQSRRKCKACEITYLKK